MDGLYWQYSVISSLGCWGGNILDYSRTVYLWVSSLCKIVVGKHSACWPHCIVIVWPSSLYAVLACFCRALIWFPGTFCSLCSFLDGVAPRVALCSRVCQTDTRFSPLSCVVLSALDHMLSRTELHWISILERSGILCTLLLWYAIRNHKSRNTLRELWLVAPENWAVKWVAT